MKNMWLTQRLSKKTKILNDFHDILKINYHK
jgi:hypothetical protein